MTYSEKLRDSRWQKKRLEVLQREDFKCQSCKKNGTVIEGDHVQVHHGYYEKGLEPWEYDCETLFCLCEKHHKQAQSEMMFLKRMLGRVQPHQIAVFIWVAIFFCGFGRKFRSDEKLLKRATRFISHARKLWRFSDLNLDDATRGKLYKLQ